MTLVLDGCKVLADHYAVNLADENVDANVIIKNSYLVGYSAIQVWSPKSANVTVKNSTLCGLNKWSGGSDDFATIVVESKATGMKFNFEDCLIYAIEQGSAKEYLMSIRTTVSELNFKGCRFYCSNKEVLAEDVNSASQGYLDNLIIS